MSGHDAMSRQELAECTGKSQARTQLRFLRHNGIKHYVDPDTGFPVVLRRWFDGDDKKADDSPWKPHKAS